MDPSRLTDALRAAADELLLLAGAAERGEDIRQAAEDSVSEIRSVLAATYGPRPRAAKGEGAQWKMLAYLLERVNVSVSGDELAEVARIKSWARRIRQLRDEHGYEIEEEGDNYRLLSSQPNEAVASAWRVSNGIRRQGGSAKGRVAALFAANVGEVLHRDQLDYVANKVKEGTRRMRELRDQEGWPIQSHLDDPDLAISEYRLVSADPADRKDPRQRLYPEKLREKVFARDAYTCRECGRDRAAADAAGDHRFFLEVHHLRAVAEQIDALPASELNDPANLSTMCHACHSAETAAFQTRRRSERRM